MTRWISSLRRLNASINWRLLLARWLNLSAEKGHVEAQALLFRGDLARAHAQQDVVGLVVVLAQVQSIANLMPGFLGEICLDKLADLRAENLFIERSFSRCVHSVVLA